MIANSVGPKSHPTENVMDRGPLVQQFASKCGEGLVEELASSATGTWGEGDLRETSSFELYRGWGTPSRVVHLCLPSDYNGDHTKKVG